MFTRAATFGRVDAIKVSDGKLITVDEKEIKCYVASDLLSGPITQIAHMHTQHINTMDVIDSNVITGSNDLSSSLFSLEMGEQTTTLLQSSLPIKHVAIMSKYAAIVSDELDIKLIDILDITKIKVLSGHLKPIIHVSFDSQGDYLASASSDGSLFIWDLTSDTPVCKKFTNMLEKNTTTAWNISWNAFKGVIAFPGIDKQITVMEKDTWQVLYHLGNQKLSDLKHVQWSPNGKLLAGLDTKEQIIIYDPSISRTKYMSLQSCPASIRVFSWIDEVKLIALDVFGHVYLGNVKISMEKVAPLKALNAIFEDEADAVGSERDSQSENEGGDFIVDDDGGGYKDELLNNSQFKRYEERQREEYTSKKPRHVESEVERYEVQEIQAGFQSGSAPYRGTKRYLAFNMIGIIYTIDQTSYSSISVEFHDRSQRPMSFTDNYNFTMGYLGPTGALFTSDSSTETPCTISYRSFAPSTNADWIAQLDYTEIVTGIAVTSQYAIIATDMRYIRVFTLSGVQISVMCIEGPIVSITASDNTLAVLYHRGGTYHGDQNIECILIQMSDKFEIVSKHSVPISPSSKLQWICFADSGELHTFDTSGVLRSLHGSYWIPILDTRKIKNDRSDSYWPVGLTETSLMCVVCKGGDKFPPFPKPLLNEIPLQIPLLNLENSQGQVEEKRIRAAIALECISKVDAQENQRLSIEVDKLTLQLIQIACKSDRPQRALDLCNKLHLTRSIDGAIKLAVYCNMPTLADSINKIKEIRYYAEQNSFATKQHVVQERSDPAMKRARNIIDEYETNHPIVIRNQNVIKDNQADDDVVFNDDSIQINETPLSKEIAKPKYTNPFAKSKQSSDLPLESKVGSNPLEAVGILMKKKVVVASTFGNKRKTQPTLSGGIVTQNKEKKVRKTKPTKGVENTEAQEIVESVENAENIQPDDNVADDSKESKEEQVSSGVRSSLDQFKMSKPPVIHTECLVMDSQVEEESLQSVLDKVRRDPVTVEKDESSEDEMLE